MCYVERDAYCQQLLQARMRDGVICDAPVWDDLKTFDGRPWRGLVDFMWGGIPCQPYSVAGKQQGAADERDLWPDFRRVLCEVRPRFALVENVSGFLAAGGGLARVVGELAASGYDAEWDCIEACSVGAPHPRDRVWIVADASGGEAHQRGGGGLAEAQGRGESVNPTTGPRGEDVAVAAITGLPDGAGEEIISGRQADRLERPGMCGNMVDWWAVEPDVGRVAHGVASRVDRLRVIGNGWVPQVAVIPMGRVAQLLGGLQPPPGGV